MSFLRTERLILRPFVPEDAAPIFALSQEQSLRRGIPDQVYADLQEASEALALLMSQYQRAPLPTQAPLVFAVVKRASEQVIGHVGLSPYRGVVEVGYAIGEAWQGRGLATEAVRAWSRRGLTVLSLDAIWGVTARDNRASSRVLEKAGYAHDRSEEGRDFFVLRAA
jgi:RimJ/RimL family protein N-acetyltransferase